MNSSSQLKQTLKQYVGDKAFHEAMDGMREIVKSEFRYEKTHNGMICTSIDDIAYLLMVVVAKSNSTDINNEK